MRKNNEYTSNGMNFLHGLTLLFIGLKLTNHIDWSWWLVLCPLLIDWSLITLAAVVDNNKAIKTFMYKNIV